MGTRKFNFVNLLRSVLSINRQAFFGVKMHFIVTHYKCLSRFITTILLLLQPSRMLFQCCFIKHRKSKSLAKNFSLCTAFEKALQSIQVTSKSLVPKFVPKLGKLALQDPTQYSNFQPLKLLKFQFGKKLPTLKTLIFRKI